MNKEIAEQKEGEIAPVQSAALSPIQQMAQMKQMGLEVADMREMLALQKEYEANEALKQFNEAMNAFKAESITIVKDRTVTYNDTTYDHASLANIVETAAPFMSEHGLSHNWTTEQNDDTGVIRVTCTIKHKAGHSESTSLKSKADPSGGKNAIQAIASAITYLERYTFLAITGLATRDMEEDDGAGAEPEETITLDQETVLMDMIKESKADQAKFLEYMKCATLGEMPASLFTRAKRALEAKKKS